MKKNIISFVAAIFLLVVTVQNPIVAENLTIGQALTASQPLKGTMTAKPPKQTAESKVKDRSLAEALQENQTIPIVPTSEVYEAVQKKEEGADTKEFINLIKTSDVTRLDLRKPSGLSITQANALLKGTGLEGLGKAFVSAEKQYRVNAYYLMAHAAWESSWGNSKISREKNNLFGYMAYDKNPYASAHGFKDKSESVDKVAKYISENYLDENGEYYCGPHLTGMNENYATDKNWKKGIASVIVGLAHKAQKIVESNGA